MEEMVNAYKTLVGKSEGKRPFQKPMCKWDNNIKMKLKEKAVEGFWGPGDSEECAAFIFTQTLEAVYSSDTLEMAPGTSWYCNSQNMMYPMLGSK
jgi:hypothetical protein